MGQYAEAESIYQKILAIQPKNTLIVFRLYLCAQLQKNPEAAAALLRSPTIGAQSLEWYYMQGAEVLFAGNKTEAMKHIEKARLLFGSKTRPYDKTLVRLGLLDEAPED
jgi:tetratricopeptide (TPR) repeat protein